MHKELISLNCPYCSAPLVELGEEKYLCEYCGEHFESTNTASDQLKSQLDDAEKLMAIGRFEDAAATYRIIIANNDGDVRAYWGAFLCEYGIEYVTGEDGKSHPICHRISRLSALDSPDLKEVLARSVTPEKELYAKQANEIERIRSQTYEISKRQQPCEIFVCGGGSEQEVRICNKLIEEFTNDKRSVFTPLKEMGASIEAYVHPAIESADYMYVVASCADTLVKTESIWRRFMALPNKKLQVVHTGVDEQDFPYNLRRAFQRVEPINAGASDWLGTALKFAEKAKKQTKKEEEHKQPELTKADVERLINSIANQGGRNVEVKSVNEAFIAVLSRIVTGDLSGAESTMLYQLEPFKQGNIETIATLCLELAKMPRCRDEGERRKCVASIGNIAAKIRQNCPQLTIEERGLYGSLTNAKLLVYLAKCFGAIKDYTRQCFVFDLIDYGDLYDTKIINDLITMMLSLGRYEDVKEVLRAVPLLDGDFVLPAYLEKFKSEQKQTVLLGIADKIECTDNIEDDLNRYLADCDDVGVALTVVDIMTRNRTNGKPNKLQVNLIGLGGALSQIKDAAGMRTVLDNYEGRPLDGMTVDKLISIGAHGGAVAANEVLNSLHLTFAITDIGAHNMQMLINNCGINKIKQSLFNFNIDRKLAERLLSDAVTGGNPDRLDTIAVLSERVPVVEMSLYESTLLGSDPLKKEIVKILAPKTGKYATVNKTLERYLCGRDDDYDKREILEYYEDFPLSTRVLELYLNIIPDYYDETYLKCLEKYLSENRGKACELFTKHYELLIEDYETALPIILSYVQFMPEETVLRFVCEFRGLQSIKDEILLNILRYVEKPKKVEVKVNGVECNLLQAYLITLSNPEATMGDVVNALVKSGVKPDDKVVSYGKKMKFRDYIDTADLSAAAKSAIVGVLK